jgi:hypothetical protein
MSVIDKAEIASFSHLHPCMCAYGQRLARGSGAFCAHAAIRRLANGPFQNDPPRWDKRLRFVPVRYSILMTGAVLLVTLLIASPLMAQQATGGGFTIQVTVLPGGSRPSSQSLTSRPARQYDTRGLPILSQDERKRLRNTTPAPTVSIHY